MTHSKHAWQKSDISFQHKNDYDHGNVKVHKSAARKGTTGPWKVSKNITTDFSNKCLNERHLHAHACTHSYFSPPSLLVCNLRIFFLPSFSKYEIFCHAVYQTPHKLLVKGSRKTVHLHFKKKKKRVKNIPEFVQLFLINCLAKILELAYYNSCN